MVLESRGDRDQCCFFFFNDTATTEIYTLSLHDALPISIHAAGVPRRRCWPRIGHRPGGAETESHYTDALRGRSEEHTSELQSRQYLVCRLLLEKKKRCTISIYHKPLAHSCYAVIRSKLL